MKITFSISHIGLGGAQRVTLNVIDWFQKNTKDELFLFIESEPRINQFQYDVSNIEHFFFPNKPLEKVKCIRKKLIEIRPDVVITMGTPNAIYDVPALLGLGIKHIISERNDPKHFAGKRITKMLSHFLFKNADGYIFQTTEARDYYGQKVKPKSTIIPNPLYDVEKLPIKPFSGDRTKEIVTAGRLNPQKNHRLLIDAFYESHKVYPEYRLVIFGDGEEKQSDLDLIKKLGLADVVSMPGSVDRLYDRIYKSSLFVLSSDFEGMPNALIEAMALGLPCISTDCPCGGPRDIIKNGHNGVLVPVGDKSKMVEAIKGLLGNEELSMILSKNAFAIRDVLDNNKICKRWYHYIHSLKQ